MSLLKKQRPKESPARQRDARDDSPVAVQAVSLSGSGDIAIYVCECGSLFTAPATTGATCPRCGHGQAW
jgi:hypothetical protein